MIGWFGIPIKKQWNVGNIYQVPEFHDVYHVRVKIFWQTPFLRCDYFLYER
jgi:hypothetical protein